MSPLERLALAEDVLRRMAEADYRGPEPADRAAARAYFERVEADPPETGRELLERLGPIVKPLRELRYRPIEDFADVTLEELEIAARYLRAIAYSCTQGEAVLRRALLSRSST